MKTIFLVVLVAGLLMFLVVKKIEHDESLALQVLKLRRRRLEILNKYVDYRLKMRKRRKK